MTGLMEAAGWAAPMEGPAAGVLGAKPGLGKKHYRGRVVYNAVNTTGCRKGFTRHQPPMSACNAGLSFALQVEAEVSEQLLKEMEEMGFPRCVRGGFM